MIHIIQLHVRVGRCNDSPSDRLFVGLSNPHGLSKILREFKESILEEEPETIAAFDKVTTIEELQKWFDDYYFYYKMELSIIEIDGV